MTDDDHMMELDAPEVVALLRGFADRIARFIEEHPESVTGERVAAPLNA